MGSVESIKTLVVDPMRTVRKPTQAADGPARDQPMGNLDPQRIELCSVPEKLAFTRKLRRALQPSKELAKRQPLVRSEADLSREYRELNEKPRILN